MKYALYLGLLVGLVPIQTTVLESVSIAGVRPDLCLVAAVLIGFAMGPLEGLLMGFALGFLQDYFSAGLLGLNLITKGLLGGLGGAASRYITNATAVTALVVVIGLSALSGVIFLLAGRAGEDLGDAFYGVWSILLPQAIYDAAVAAGVYWLIAWRVKRGDWGWTGWSQGMSRL
jgi:rod shape-determining protein MreD